MVEQLNNHRGTTEYLMVEQGNNHDEIVEHLIVQQWNNHDERVEHLKVEQRWWNSKIFRWLDSRTSDGGTAGGGKVEEKWWNSRTSYGRTVE